MSLDIIHELPSLSDSDVEQLNIEFKKITLPDIDSIEMSISEIESMFNELKHSDILG